MEQNTYNPSWWSSEDDVSWSSAREDVARTIEAQPAEWDAMEPPLRFGFGASRHYAEQSWEEVALDLEQDWNRLESGHAWQEVTGLVQRGWQVARGA